MFVQIDDVARHQLGPIVSNSETERRSRPTEKVKLVARICTSSPGPYGGGRLIRIRRPRAGEAFVLAAISVFFEKVNGTLPELQFKVLFHCCTCSINVNT